jgi:hypothetical protein
MRHPLSLMLLIYAALHFPLPVLAENTAIVVPEASAKLARPILDLQKAWLECSGHHNVASCDFAAQTERQSRMSRLLYDLSRNETTPADQALAVLTCFQIGESQEEADAIIARGRRMIPLVERYRKASPVLLDRDYPSSMARKDKQQHFKGLTDAIEHHRRGTWDDPEG